MNELATFLKVTLGLSYKALIRAPYTHSKPNFSVLRCVVIYLRLIFLVLFFNPDLKSDSTLYKILSPASPFLFPYYKILTTLLSESSQASFWILIGINMLHIIIFFIGKIIYTGAIKLKISLYLMELIMPDMILFLVYNFMSLSIFEFYSQSLGFLVTLSLCITVCIGGPIIIMYDIEVYKTAMMMFTGLKTVKKEW